jgi:hypothetical protein
MGSRSSAGGGRGDVGPTLAYGRMICDISGTDSGHWQREYVDSTEQGGLDFERPLPLAEQTAKWCHWRNPQRWLLALKLSTLALT